MGEIEIEIRGSAERKFRRIRMINTDIGPDRTDVQYWSHNRLRLETIGSYVVVKKKKRW